MEACAVGIKTQGRSRLRSSWATARSYSATDGTLLSINTTNAGGTTTFQNLSYVYDGLGNLKTRTSGTHSESFDYDCLNRLFKQGPNVNSLVTIADYATNGNIHWKRDVSNNTVSSYAYGGAGPHAVTGAKAYPKGSVFVVCG